MINLSNGLTTKATNSSHSAKAWELNQAPLKDGVGMDNDYENSYTQLATGLTTRTSGVYCKLTRSLKNYRTQAHITTCYNSPMTLVDPLGLTALNLENINNFETQFYSEIEDRLKYEGMALMFIMDAMVWDFDYCDGVRAAYDRFYERTMARLGGRRWR